MSTYGGDWQERVDRLWTGIDDHDGAAFVAAMHALAAERPAGDAIASFELGGAYDSTGDPVRAVARYEAALEAGLPEGLRQRATIQLASSLRNLGEAPRAVALLTDLLRGPCGELEDAARAFLALALTSAGREREAVGVTLTALAPHLSRYRRSVTAYAAELAPADE